MGLWPDRGNENQRRPHESGDPSSVQMDSRLRGNDVTFRSEARNDIAAPVGDDTGPVGLENA